MGEPPAGIRDAGCRRMNRHESIEYRGVGQSGYTAGRAEHDLALECQMLSRNPVYPRNEEEEQLGSELDTDDRWYGRGGEIPPDDEVQEERT